MLEDEDFRLRLTPSSIDVDLSELSQSVHILTFFERDFEINGKI